MMALVTSIMCMIESSKGSRIMMEATEMVTVTRSPINPVLFFMKVIHLVRDW